MAENLSFELSEGQIQRKEFLDRIKYYYALVGIPVAKFIYSILYYILKVARSFVKSIIRMVIRGE